MDFIKFFKGKESLYMHMTQGKLNKNLVIAIKVTIIATALAIAPALLSNEAIAQANNITQGSGQGTVVCPEPVGTKPSMSISFSSTSSKGTAGGTWKVGDGLKNGSITGGSFSKAQHFQLSGLERADSLCRLPLGASITISGQCGSGIAIEFKASNGETGRFTGSVLCS